jgi:YHS domain-containing protein
MRSLFTMLFGLCIAAIASASTFINTVGSDDSVAISGYDTVAFFTEKKAVFGKQEFEYEYLEAKWRFFSQANLDDFKKDPENYIPAWGGQCAWCVSENCVSAKKLSGDFEILDGKLYLFAYGSTIKNSAKDDFLYGRTSRTMRIREGEKYWSQLKEKLKAGEISQPGSANYKRTKFDQ